MADYSPVWHIDWLDDWWDASDSGGGGGGSGGSGPVSGLCPYGGFTNSPASSEYDYAHRFIPFLDVEVPLYVVGWAYDGECAKSVYVSDIDEAYRVFGGVMVHRVSLSPGQTSFSVPLRIAPQGWSISVTSGNHVLRNVSLVGTPPFVKTVQFDAVPVACDVEFAYHPAPLDDEDISYLPALLRAAFLLGCTHVVGVRVPGGQRAQATWSGWTVRARSEGRLYDGTRVRVFSDRIEVAVPNRLVRSYARNTDLHTLFSRIAEVEFIPPTSLQWPSGLDVTLSGGYTARFTGASLLALANLWAPEVPGVVLVPSMSVGNVCQTAATAFGVAMESAHCAVVYCTSVQNISSIDG